MKHFLNIVWMVLAAALAVYLLLGEGCDRDVQ